MKQTNNINDILTQQYLAKLLCSSNKENVILGLNLVYTTFKPDIFFYVYVNDCSSVTVKFNLIVQHASKNIFSSYFEGTNDEFKWMKKHINMLRCLIKYGDVE